jgi:hypothetical protein
MSGDLTKYSVVEDQVFEIIFEAECASLTGRSRLTFQAGRLKGSNGALHIRLVKNSGKGMFCKDWASIESIDAIVARADAITARTFNAVHPGKSINTGGFILAVLNDLGVVQAKDDNSRHHERIANMTLADAVAARIAEANGSTSSKATRKSKAE